MPVPFLTAYRQRLSVNTQTAARKNRRYAIIDNRKRDKWSGGFAPYGYTLEKGKLFVNEE